MTLSNYNSNENADFNCGEMTLSNYDFNATANYEPSESEDIHILIPDITSMICDHIIMKFYYRKYMLKKKIHNEMRGLVKARMIAKLSEVFGKLQRLQTFRPRVLIKY